MHICEARPGEYGSVLKLACTAPEDHQRLCAIDLSGFNHPLEGRRRRVLMRSINNTMKNVLQRTL